MMTIIQKKQISFLQLPLLTKLKGKQIEGGEPTILKELFRRQHESKNLQEWLNVKYYTKNHLQNNNPLLETLVYQFGPNINYICKHYHKQPKYIYIGIK